MTTTTAPRSRWTGLPHRLRTSTTPYAYTFDHADVTYGPGGSNLQIPNGTDATLTGKPSAGSAASCAEKFVPFPQ